MSRTLYLGREAQSQARIELRPEVFTTHGVLLGMTGSGKTGLALSLLEEMVEAGVPVLAIDPKGDLPNLALLFPEFGTHDFAAWADPTEAQRAGLTLEQLAAQKAQSWKQGLSDWGIPPERVASLRQRLDLRVWTPGSSVGRSVNLLGDFQPPDPGMEAETRAELAASIASGLLSLIGNPVDPLRDPRHVLVTAILHFVWERGAGLSLEELITHLVDPPFPKVGVFPVDRFLSPDDRMKVALALNNLVASPAFAAWKQGAPLDVAAMMQASEGRVPVNLFYLAHLDEKERQFFVGRLMTEVLSWSRSLPGSSSLRSLVYFDEVAGYLPPYPASPPSKPPILTLLKQSRAVGVGLCLATQNPVDLDYKALSNIGTWMIGRLPTQQDQERVRDGLLSADGGVAAQQLAAAFSDLKPRSFLLRTPASPSHQVLQTRWAMSFLRGPVTLAELPRLPLGDLGPAPAVSRVPRPRAIALTSERATPPPVPKGFGQSFLDPRYVFGVHHGGVFEPFRQPAREDGTIRYEPGLRATLKLTFSQAKESFLWHQVHHYVAFPLGSSREVSSLFQPVSLETEYLLTQPPAEGRFGDLPDAFDQSEEFAEAQRALVDHLYRTLTATRYLNKAVALYSRPNETQEQFLERCREAAESLEDEAAVKLRQKMQARIDRLEDQMTRARDKVERLAQSANGKRIEGLWNAGELLLGMFSSKRKKSFSSVLNKSRQAAEASTKTSQAEAELQRLQEEVVALQEELETALDELDAEYAARGEAIEATEIRLAKKDIVVETFELLWVPVSARL